jgi:outer membrane lipopolysaccharide assembly protein LptE/RlpB
LAQKVVEKEMMLEEIKEQYENQISSRLKEVAELQEALKEKARKCQAWEKVIFYEFNKQMQI